MNNINFRLYTRSDRNELISLYQRALNKSYSERWFDWLYNDTFNSNSLILVAEHEGAIVGAISEIRKTIVHNGNQFQCGRHVDPVVAPSMQGKKVFSRLLKAVHEISEGVVDFYYCFPNEASLPGFLKNGYVQAGPFRTPKHQAKYLGVPLKEKVRYFLTGAKTAGRKSSSVEKVPFERLRGLDFHFPHNRFMLLKSYDYINWRYVRNPLKSYELLIQLDNQKVRSACVIKNRGDCKYAIIDFFQFDPVFSMREFLLFIRDNLNGSEISIWDTGYGDIPDYFYGKDTHNFLVREGKTKMPDSFFNKDHWWLTAGEVESN